MGVFQRLSDLLKSNVNDLIDRAEDPEKMVKQIIIDMQTELTKATQNYGKAKASERLAEKKYLEAQKISSDWEAKAKMALSKGDQELAKQALARKVKADEDLNNYKEMYESISAQTDAIGDQVEVLRLRAVRLCSSLVLRWLKQRRIWLRLQAASMAIPLWRSSRRWRRRSSARKLRQTLLPRSQAITLLAAAVTI